MEGPSQRTIYDMSWWTIERCPIEGRSRRTVWGSLNQIKRSRLSDPDLDGKIYSSALISNAGKSRAVATTECVLAELTGQGKVKW